MTHDDELFGQLERYLAECEGSTPLPDATRRAVRAALSATRQKGPHGLTTYPALARRKPAVARFGLVAAAVVAIAFIGINVVAPGMNSGNGVSSPTPDLSATPKLTATPEPSATPKTTPMPSTVAGPGTFVIHMAGASPDFQPYQATYTLPDKYGWTTTGPISGAPGVGGISVWALSGIYPDPCHWQQTQQAPLPTRDPASPYLHTDEIAAMLARQPARNPSASTHVAVGGWPATRIELTRRLPEDLNIAGCDGGQYRSWSDPTGLGGPAFQDCPCEPRTAQREAVYVLDIDRGVVLVDVWSYPGMTSEGGQDALNAILASLVVALEP